MGLGAAEPREEVVSRQPPGTELMPWPWSWRLNWYPLFLAQGRVRLGAGWVDLCPH